MPYSELFDLILDNLKKAIFPEEWLDIDLALSKHEIFTMMQLERKGEITMTQLAEYVNVSMSTATGIVDRLVKNGYLSRNRTETDRRIVMITLTDKAKNLIADIKTIGTNYLTLVGDSLTEEERAFLYRIFTKIIGILNTNQDSISTKSEQDTVSRIPIE